MRIIGGEHRGRPLLSPEGRDTRPTSDRARQAIFNILHHAKWLPHPAVENACVLDAFAGTGALGLESLSQGAADAVFLEQAPTALAVCKRNIASLGLERQATALKADALTPSQRPASIAPRTLVFLDPPYGKNMGCAALAALVASDWLAPQAVCVLEMDKKRPEPVPDGFRVEDERTYGIALVRFMVFSGAGQ